MIEPEEKLDAAVKERLKEAERRLRREVDARVEEARSKALASNAKSNGGDDTSNNASVQDAEKKLRRAQEKLDSLRSKDAAKSKEEKNKKTRSRSKSNKASKGKKKKRGKSCSEDDGSGSGYSQSSDDGEDE